MLYISDLDGTLLDSNGELTDYSVDTIRKFIDEGGLFTIATARSVFTAERFIRQLGISLPVILRNGAFIYEPGNFEILHSNLLGGHELENIMEFFLHRDLHPILHHIENGEFRVDYTGIYNYGEEHYFDSRKKEDDRRLRIIDGYDETPCSDCISICIIDDNDKLRIIHDELDEGPGNNFMIHRYIDTYSNHTWLEISHREATKGNACRNLIEITESKYYTAFGDNINDLDMLKNAEKAYIPENSHLAAAGFDFEQIASNDEDGVASFISRNLL